MTLVRHSGRSRVNPYADCVECMKESVVWGQCVRKMTYSGHFCSLECLRVWAIKERIKR